MKLFVLLVIFSQVLYSINAETMTWNQNITLVNNDINNNINPLIGGDGVYLPPYYPGNLTITVVTPYPVQICFLPFPSNNFAGCDSSNSFSLALPQPNQAELASNWLQSENNQINLREDFFGENFDLQFEKYLMAAPKVNQTTFNLYGLFRANTAYYVIAQWSSSASHNDTITVTVKSTTSCSDSQIALPDGACVNPIAGSQTVNFTQQNIPQNGSQWWSFTINDSPAVGHYYNSFILKAGTIGTGDAEDQDYYIDFYLKKDSPPLTTNYDLYAKLPRLGSLVVGGDIQRDTIYYFLTKNSNNKSIELGILTEVTQCPFGKFGNNCSSNATQITTNSSITSKVTGSGGMMYFTINTTQLIFGVGIEKLDSPAPAIYGSVDTAPDSNFYLLHSTSTNNSDAALNSIRLFYGPHYNQSSYWVIAVNTTADQEFYYWANTNCAYNCVPQNTKKYKSPGTCDWNTGKCTCPSGYQYLWCDKKGFPGWAIALIVIAVILIIICFIGLPLVWYLRKRRARYEQV